MASTDPKTATQGQWEDLASRVQSKAEIGTVLSTPSSTVFVQTANIADGAITTDKITDTAVTPAKIDYSALEKYVDYASNVALPSTPTQLFTYTAQATGYYLVLVCANLESISSTHTSYITVRKNGTPVDTSYVTSTSGVWGNLSLQNAFSLNAGDILTVYLHDSTGLGASSNTRIRFVVVRI